MKNYDIMIKNTSYLDPTMNVRSGVDLLIADGIVQKIRAANTYPVGEETAAEILNGEHLLWMAGMTDTHIHTSQQFLRGRLLDVKPVIWKKVNVPFESRLDERTSRLSAQSAAMEMIACGTTAFVDAGGKYPEVYAQVYEAAGLHGRVSVMTNDNPGMPASLRIATPEEGVRRQREMAANLKSISPGGRIQPIYSITTPTAASEEMYRAILEAAVEDDIPFETHLNEYASEVNDFIERYGERPFVWLEREKLIPQKMFAAHCIFLSPEEIDIIAEHQIRVGHCPFSNCGKGVPNTPQLLRSGVSCGFGSDGAGHGGLDLFREMRLLRGVMNAVRGTATADSRIMPSRTLLSMATKGGAAALFGSHMGTIEEQQPADLIAVNMDAVSLWHTQDAVNSLVESASGSDILHSIICGKLVMKNREFLTLDREKIRYELKRAVETSPWLLQW